MNFTVRIQKTVFNRWEIVCFYDELMVYNLNEEKQKDAFNISSSIDKSKHKGIVLYDFKQRKVVDEMKEGTAIAGMTAEQVSDMHLFLIDIVSAVNHNNINKFTIHYMNNAMDMTKVSGADRFNYINKFASDFLYGK